MGRGEKLNQLRGEYSEKYHKSKLDRLSKLVVWSCQDNHGSKKETIWRLHV